MQVDGADGGGEGQLIAGPHLMSPRPRRAGLGIGGVGAPARPAQCGVSRREICRGDQQVEITRPASGRVTIGLGGESDSLEHDGPDSRPIEGVEGSAELVDKDVYGGVGSRGGHRQRGLQPSREVQAGSVVREEGQHVVLVGTCEELGGGDVWWELPSQLVGGPDVTQGIADSLGAACCGRGGQRGVFVSEHAVCHQLHDLVASQVRGAARRWRRAELGHDRRSQAVQRRDAQLGDRIEDDGGDLGQDDHLVVDVDRCAPTFEDRIADVAAAHSHRIAPLSACESRGSRSAASAYVI